MLSYKWVGVGILAFGMTACYEPARHRSLSPSAEFGRPPAGATIYRIDTARSSLRVLAYRAGPMAQLGHDHVITNNAMSGWVAVGSGIASSSFSIDIPVAAFVVDDPDARRREGPAFAGDIGASAKEGTRRHMLGADLLDAQVYPSILVQSGAIAGTEPGLRAAMTIHVAGHAAKVTEDLLLRRDGKELSATAAFDLRQSALGLAPYSIMMGALRVRDDLRLKIRIVAVRG